MRQHAILSCLILLFGWGLFFGLNLFQTINAMTLWRDKILFFSVIPASVLTVLWYRQKCRRVIFKANLWGFLGLLCLLGVRLYADLTQRLDWQLLSILLMLPFIVLASLGTRAWLAWCFPSMAVLFSYPNLSHFPAWLKIKILSLVDMLVPWSTQDQIIPLTDFTLHSMVISAFYGYFRYSALGQRVLFYSLSAAVFLTLVCVQACGLSGLLYWGGQELVSQFNLFQLNQILMILGIGFLAYVLSVLAPYKPPIRRMMNDNMDFVILIDRHSHWLALTVVALILMALSVWLGGNIHQMSLSVMEIWR